jgi:hypothetical protein
MKRAPLFTLIGFGAGNGPGIANAFGSAGFRLALLSRTPTKQGDALTQLAFLGVTVDSFAADTSNLGRSPPGSPQ